MVLMGEGEEGAQGTSLSPMGCGGDRQLRDPAFMDCTRQAWSQARVALQCPREHSSGVSG